MRRVLGVLAGAAVGNAIYFALAFGVLQPIQQASGESPEEWLGVAFYVLMPFGLFTGGVLTGYISRTIRPPRLWLAALHAPGLYTFLGSLPFILDTVRSFQIFMFLAGAAWVFSSALGVLVGTRWHGRSTSAA